jgi:hypothetical protein
VAAVLLSADAPVAHQAEAHAAAMSPMAAAAQIGADVPAVGGLPSPRPTTSSGAAVMRIRLQVRHMWEAVRYGDVDYY